MARQKNHTATTTEDLVSHLEHLRQQVFDLAHRLSGGDITAYRTLKFQKRALKQAEQQLRFHQKRERRLAWSV